MKKEIQNKPKYNAGLMTFLDYYSLTIVVVASMIFGMIVGNEGQIILKICVGLLILRRIGYLERRTHLLGKLERRIFED